MSSIVWSSPVSDPSGASSSKKPVQLRTAEATVYTNDADGMQRLRAAFDEEMSNAVDGVKARPLFSKESKPMANTSKSFFEVNQGYSKFLLTCEKSVTTLISIQPCWDPEHRDGSEKSQGNEPSELNFRVYTCSRAVAYRNSRRTQKTLGEISFAVERRGEEWEMTLANLAGLYKTHSDTEREPLFRLESILGCGEKGKQALVSCFTGMGRAAITAALEKRESEDMSHNRQTVGATHGLVSQMSGDDKCDPEVLEFQRRGLELLRDLGIEG